MSTRVHLSDNGPGRVSRNRLRLDSGAYRRGVRTQHAAPATSRPTPLQWLRYAFGGGLPRTLAPWVLSDTTRPGWVRRHVARSLVQLSPLVVLCLVAVPVGMGYRLTAAVGGLMVGLMYSLAFMVETTEHRGAKAGYPAGTAAPLH